MDKRQKFVFSPTAKKLLKEILKKYSSVVENKQTDGATLRKKNEAWDAITREFNASPLTLQHVKHQQLRKLWQNLKQRQRDALTKERQHRFATGGGPAIEDADIDPDVSQITSSLIVGVDNAIDSDTTELEYSMALVSPSSNDLNSPVPDPDPTPSTSTAPFFTTPLQTPTPPPRPNYVNPNDPDPTPSTSTAPAPPLPTPLLTPTPPPRPLQTPAPLPRPLQTPAPLPRPLQTPTPPPRPLQTPPPRPLQTPPPCPLQTPTPPPRPLQLSTPPPRPPQRSQDAGGIRGTVDVLRKEYEDRKQRLEELHQLQKELLIEQIKEARAKAELAQFILNKHKSGQL